jgi:hypothetical protein
MSSMVVESCHRSPGRLLAPQHIALVHSLVALSVCGGEEALYMNDWFSTIAAGAPSGRGHTIGPHVRRSTGCTKESLATVVGITRWNVSAVHGMLVFDILLGSLVGAAIRVARYDVVYVAIPVP